MNIQETHLQKPVTATTHTPIVEISKMLRDKKLRHIYILDEKEFPVGIISITDINAKIVAEGKSPAGITASAIMTTPIHLIDINNELSKAYFEMIKHGTLSMPVVKNGLLVGVLSMDETLRHMVQHG